MLAMGRWSVAKGGRPKKSEGKAKTKHTRINDDLAEMLSWVLEVLGKEWTSARVLDPHIRGPITALYKQNEPAINALKRARRARTPKREPEE